MSIDEKPSRAEALPREVKAQRKKIDELESQLDYFKKRFAAARQAAKW